MNWFKKTIEKMRNSKIEKDLSYAMNHAYPRTEVPRAVEAVLMDEPFWGSEFGRKALLKMFMKDHVSVVLDVMKRYPYVGLKPEKEQKEAFIGKVNDLVECLKKHTDDAIFNLHPYTKILKVQNKSQNNNSSWDQKKLAAKVSAINMYYGKMKKLEQMDEAYYLSEQEKLQGSTLSSSAEKARDICKYIYEPYLERAQSSSDFDSEKEAERLLGNMLITQVNSHRLSNHLKALLFKRSVNGLVSAPHHLQSLYVMSKFWLDAEVLDKQRAHEELKTYFSKQIKSLNFKDSLESAIQLVNKNIPEEQRSEFSKNTLGLHYGCLCLIERDWNKVHQFFDVHSKISDRDGKLKTAADFLVKVILNQIPEQFEKDEKEWADLLNVIFKKDKAPRDLALKISKVLEEYNNLDPTLKSVSLLMGKVYAFTIKEIHPTAHSKPELKPQVLRF